MKTTTRDQLAENVSFGAFYTLQQKDQDGCVLPAANSQDNGRGPQLHTHERI